MPRGPSGEKRPADTVQGAFKVSPLQLVVRYEGDDEFIASFPEAGISIAGDSFNDALSALKSELVELYEIYKDEPVLGPEPKRQIAILEKHFGKGARAMCGPGRPLTPTRS